MATLAIKELFNLSGKSAIVTGAAQGIGQAIALRLAEAGASVLLAGHNRKGLEQSAAMITATGGKAAWIFADVLNMEDLDKIVQSAMDSFGSIDILVNCAGGAHPFTPALEVTEETWDKTVDRNLKGSFFLAQKAARQMVAAGNGGRIINIGSIAGLKPDPQLADYNASKAGLAMLTKSLAQEFGQHNILVNTVAPGPIMTPNSAAFYEIPEIQKIISQRTPLGHVGQPEDIANAVLFFAGRAANHVTGSVLVVDGGMLTT
jgi:NAD(P)-dependent dehydrogenase (short-subunit alcohol dehydrogenase family)